MTLLDCPVVVTGTPRSGKSLVAKLLRESPEFAFLSEPLMIWDIGIGHRHDDRRTANEATESIRQRIRMDCQAHVQQAGKQRYLDDLAYHSIRVPFLRRVMPEAKIIHTIRSGEDALPELLFGWTYRDTVARAFARRRRNIKLNTLPRLAVQFARNYLRSRVRGRRATWGPRVPGLSDFAAAHSPAEVAAYQWRSMVEIALDDFQDLSSEQVLEVRLEKLLADPPTEMRRIATFCGVADIDHLSEFASALVDPGHQFENKIWPSESDWDAVRRIIDPLQKRLGYTTQRSVLP